MSIKREILLAALERIKPALRSAGSMEELKYVWLDGTYLFAHNGGLGIRLKFKAEVEPFGVLGSVLIGLLQKSSAAEVEIDGGEFQVGRSKAKLATLPGDSNPWPYPARAPTGSAVLASFALTDALLEGIKRARIVKARKPIDVEEHGVVLFPGRDDLALYASGGDVLAEVIVKEKLSSDLDRVVLPYEFCAQLVGMKAGTKVVFLKDCIIAESDGTQVCSNLLDSSGVENLPETMNSTVPEGAIRVNLPEDFKEGVKRAEVLAGNELYGKGGAPTLISLSGSKKELTVKGKLKHGDIHETFALTKNLSGRVTVGLDHLLDVYAEAEAISIVEKALVFYGKGDSTYAVAVKSSRKEEPKKSRRDEEDDE